MNKMLEKYMAREILIVLKIYISTENNSDFAEV